MSRTNKDKSTIRTSPTISMISYEVYKTYGIPISNYLERQSMEIVMDDDKLKHEIWIEIKLREEIIKFYEEQKRIIDKKISRFELEIEDLQQGLVDGIREETSKNIQSALAELMKWVSNQNKKLDTAQHKGHRYDIKKMPMDDIVNICDNNNITPKMVLPLIDRNVLKNYFDDGCRKFVK